MCLLCLKLDNGIDMVCGVTDEEAFDALVKGWGVVDLKEEELPRPTGLCEQVTGKTYNQLLCEHDIHPNFGMCVNCGYNPNDGGWSKLSEKPTSSTSCSWGMHTWVTYTGLREVYEYCTECGEKRK